MSEAQLERSEAQLEGSEAQLEGPERGCTNGRTVGQMEGRTENLLILQDFVPYWGRWKGRIYQLTKLV